MVGGGALRVLVVAAIATACAALLHQPAASPFLAKSHIASKLGNAPRTLIVASNIDVDDDFYIQDTYKSERLNRPNPARRAKPTPIGLPLPNFQSAGNGLVFLAVGVLATAVGMSLFFDTTLIRIGTICLLIGVPTTFGVDTTLRTLMAPRRLHATACLAAGVFLVMLGRTFFGVLLEIFGFLNLFGNMFPLLLAMARSLPGVGQLLNSVSRPAPRSSFNNF